MPTPKQQPCVKRRYSRNAARVNGPLSVHTRRLVHLLGISGNAAHLLRVLLDHADAKSWDDCFPGKGTLASEACCSLSTVKKSLAELSAAGIITVTPRPKDGLRWDSNTYAIQPAAFAGASQKANAPRAPRALPARSPRALPRASHDRTLGCHATPNVAKGMQPVMEPAIMQPPRERTEENHNENLRPSTGESTTNPGFAGSDDLAPSRSQTETPPPLHFRASLRDESLLVKPECTRCGSSRFSQFAPPASAPAYVCPGCKLEEKRAAGKRKRAATFAKAS